jgi:hypothetical protein
MSRSTRADQRHIGQAYTKAEDEAEVNAGDRHDHDAVRSRGICVKMEIPCDRLDSYSGNLHEAD